MLSLFIHSCASIIYPKTDLASNTLLLIPNELETVIWIGRSKMDIRQIRNTIFTFAKWSNKFFLHSSGQQKHSRSVTRAATRALHLWHHCLLVFIGFFSAAIHPIETYSEGARTCSLKDKCPDLLKSTGHLSW